LISPAFLASEFIWNHEIKPIFAHNKQGMDVLPLLVRPCAWRLAPDLARLQARPTDDRALSTGSDSEIDSNLAAFTYELAAKTGSAKAAADDKSLLAQPRRADDPIGVWAGYYNRVRPIRLTIVEHARGQFWGRLEYPNEGTVTTVEGKFHKRLPMNDPVWAQVGGMESDAFHFAVSFSDRGYEVRGGPAIAFDGEYRAVVVGREMIGGWFSSRQAIGSISLRRV
jgi:hypothetical protein